MTNIDTERAREQAIGHIERNRRYWINAAIFTVGMLVILAVWAIVEYHNAGGWPTKGLTRVSGVHDMWNLWVVYPAMAWAFLATAISMGVHPRKAVSERRIKHELEHMAH